MKFLQFLGVVTTSLVPVVSGWGAVGHEVVATIAQIHLHPSVLPNICEILNYTATNPNVPQCHLAPIATWADKLRYRMRWSATMHYIGAVDDYPSKTCAFPGSRGWEKSVNVLGAIRNGTDILERWMMKQHAQTGNSLYDHVLANEALKFLVHFVGDMHQPLHLTGRDRGGNSDKVLFDNRQTNLHSVWDNSLIAKTLRNIPYNYTRPLPIKQVEYNLRGTIYDPWIRRIIWEGLYSRWKEEANTWLECPQEDDNNASRSAAGFLTSLPFGLNTVFQYLQLLFTSRFDDTDDAVLCPYHWAKPIHVLNCELIWPKALDEPPYKHFRLDANEDEEWIEGAKGNPQKYLELDTPEYAGVVYKQFLLEKLMAQAGVRLAGILNYLFADIEEDKAEFRRRLSIVLAGME